MAQASDKTTLILKFDDPKDLENWVAAYEDGGGDQTCGYVSFGRAKARGSPLTLLLRGYRQCPECRFGDIGTMEEFRDRFKDVMKLDKTYKILDKKKTHKCQNCGCECSEKEIVNG